MSIRLTSSTKRGAPRPREIAGRNEVLSTALAHIVVVVGAMHDFGIDPSWSVPVVPGY